MLPTVLGTVVACCPEAVSDPSPTASASSRPSADSRLTKARTPPTCSGIFTDVECTPTPAFAVDWIEQLHAEGVTDDCDTNPLIYCPGSSVTRGQMAVFLVKTVNLQ